MKRLVEMAALLGLLALAACSGQPETGPVPVRWDQATCARCIMAVSDHNFAAEVRGAEAGRKTKVYFFDDFGCAALWLAEQPWRNDPRTEMWVTDYQSGQWLNAFAAHYLRGHLTPMDYGLGAEADSTAGSLTYEQAVTEVNARETKLH